MTQNTSVTTKKLVNIRRNNAGHWVGDGFPVRTLFNYSDQGTALSPFLMLDYAGPTDFPPTQQRRGVGEHPHRGFETVTIVYAGEVEHRDSSGGGGKIGPGDVQWMTAASGLVHEEFHGRDYAARGGPFEMVQLWVNLPASEKMSPPRYQAILDKQIPAIKLPDSQGTVRVIAGEYAGVPGPTRTFTPIHVWDLDLNITQPIELAVPTGYTTLLVVLKGAVQTGAEIIAEAEVGVFERSGQTLRIDRAPDTRALLLCGQPIEEAIVGYGPFVMNTREEIQQAMQDYQSGGMGHLS
ncbi:MAG: pirin family protein [Thiobacillaceae bacterium]